MNVPPPNVDGTIAAVRQLTIDRLDLLAAKEKIDRQIADIDEALTKHLPTVGGRYELPEVPGQGVRLAPGKRTFSKERAAAMLTPTQYQAASALVITAASARNALGNTIVNELCCTVGAPSVQTLRSNGDRR